MKLLIAKRTAANNKITIVLNKGDFILAGKFKTKKAEIIGFDTDKHGQPLVITTKGTYSVLKFRLVKLMEQE